jgi:hypothetical protein
MAKDQKGHGSEGKLGKTGRTAKEYEAHLRSSGSPETMSRKDGMKNMGPKGEKRPSPASLGYHAEGGKVKTGAPSVEQSKKRPARGRDTKTNQRLDSGWRNGGK